MRRHRAALVAAVLLLSVQPAARAHPAYDFEGRCTFVTANVDPGRPDVYTGEVDAYVVATDDRGVPVGVPISVDCVLVVNGIPERTVLTASGTGAAAGVASLEFTAGPHDVINLCDEVTVGGEFHRVCVYRGPGHGLTQTLCSYDHIEDVPFVCRRIG